VTVRTYAQVASPGLMARNSKSAASYDHGYSPQGDAARTSSPTQQMDNCWKLTAVPATEFLNGVKTYQNVLTE
jgi:hypothetical protein